MGVAAHGPEVRGQVQLQVHLGEGRVDEQADLLPEHPVHVQLAFLGRGLAGEVEQGGHHGAAPQRRLGDDLQGVVDRTARRLTLLVG